MTNIKSKESCVIGYVDGSLNELMVDTIMIVRHVYQAVENQSEEAAKDFERCIKIAFDDGVPFCKDEKLGDICKGSVEELKRKMDAANAKDDIKNMLNEAIKEIDNLTKDLKGLVDDEK